ncbi:MAG: 3-octaprenyl-4-hydroxybenzoate carboxy-lyase, partial [Gammaproteobacteria bacterium]|nr:3-octaprenyl-4-hydroxybenzoate carboxy-lyase [Gammaproteobacteria bacterium]
MKKLVIGMSGASGVIYGIRLLEILNRQPSVETHLIMSSAAKMNIAIETDYSTDQV